MYMSAVLMEQHDEYIATHPAARRFVEIHRVRAESAGGLVLRVYKLRRGLWWGEPAMLNPSECAEALNVTVADVNDAMGGVGLAAYQEWAGTPEGLAWIAEHPCRPKPVS